MSEIKVENISKSFGNTCVLKDISYTWQLSEDNENWTDASNEKDYKIPGDAVGKYVRFKAQPSSKATNK